MQVRYSRRGRLVSKTSALAERVRISPPVPNTEYLGIAQPGSALVLGTRGRWFESSYRDHWRVGRAVEGASLEN